MPRRREFAAEAMFTLERADMPCGAMIKPLRAALALSAAVAMAQIAAAATVTVDTERNAGSVDVRASAVLNVDAATAWRVLTAYDRYVEFIPDLHVSHVVARRGAKVTVEQSGDVALWRLKVPMSVTFEISESAPDWIQSRAVAGSLKALESCYALTPVAQGLRLDYVGRVTPGFLLFGSIGQTVVEHNIARQFQALADEIERQGTGVLSRSAPAVGDALFPEHRACDAITFDPTSKRLAKH
jgi:hypothetical protein